MLWAEDREEVSIKTIQKLIMEIKNDYCPYEFNFDSGLNCYGGNMCADCWELALDSDSNLTKLLYGLVSNNVKYKYGCFCPTHCDLKLKIKCQYRSIDPKGNFCVNCWKQALEETK